MGGWVMEVGRMAMYVSFPVAMFHYFNQPELYEKWVTEKKREIYPPMEKTGKAQLEQLIREMREKADEERLKALERMEQKQNQNH